MIYFAVYSENRTTGEILIKKVNAETTEDATNKANVTNDEYIWNGTCGFDSISDRVEMIGKGLYKFKQSYIDYMNTWR